MLAKRLATVGVLATTALLAVPTAAQADTIRSLSWHLDYLKIPQAHTISQGEGVIVAVIDSGVDATHPDLQGQVLPGKGIGPDTTPDGRTDPDGHGTAMAGLIVGRGGGDEHVLGVAPRAKVLPIALGRSGTSEGTAQGIRWAADHGAHVISISLGGQAEATADERAAAEYAMAKGSLVVAASGNKDQGDTRVTSLGRVPGVLTVGGISRSGAMWSGSVSGPEVAVVAPGASIVSTDRRSATGYGSSSGTSNAAAIVSGQAALIRAKFPTAAPASVINRIVRTVKDVGRPGRDDSSGFGIIDPVTSLTAAIPDVGVNPLSTQPVKTQAAAKSAPKEPQIGVSIKWRIMGPLLAGVVLLVALVLFVLVRANRRARRRQLAQRALIPPGYGPSAR
ncbi:S8 family serine peptidase [Longispora albida]|uniref:S8 family serine peptidase n=1 Tax=Longispora albida TaxID=203523 RepID=UPI0012FBDA0D|nr:S8 family serine peptidase [Longispora albida]